MKKWIVLILALAIVVGGALDLTCMFTRNKLTAKLYQVENIYEEIWNLVSSESQGTPTALTTATEDAYIAYDFAQFQSVIIPVDDEYFISIGYEDNKTAMRIWVSKRYDPYSGEPRDTTLYVYDYENNTLYGDREEAYLMEKFISLYDSWVGDAGKFPSGDRGDYTYQYLEYPLSYNGL